MLNDRFKFVAQKKREKLNLRSKSSLTARKSLEALREVKVKFYLKENFAFVRYCLRGE